METLQLFKGLLLGEKKNPQNPPHRNSATAVKLPEVSKGGADVERSVCWGQERSLAHVQALGGLLLEQGQSPRNLVRAGGVKVVSSC